MESLLAPDGAPNWVTVADAARQLTATGDEIDASNVSRYLKRFRDIPQKREGKFRYVDLTALVAHRAVNVRVSDKQAARSITVPPPSPREGAPDSGGEGDTGTPRLGAINLALKELELSKRQREEALAAGTVIHASEVLELISATLRALVGGMETGEATIAQRYGREIAAEFRRLRKSAQGSASSRLGELARKHLPAHLVSAAVAAGAQAMPDPRDDNGG